MSFINLTEFEETIVTTLSPLSKTRKIVPYANPSDYDLTNVPANGMGYTYVNVGNISTPALPTNKNFGPLITQPVVDVTITLVQRGNYSHKLCYPTIEQIISLLHGFEYGKSRLIFNSFSYQKQDGQDKCWQYNIKFSYLFDFVGCSSCC